MSSKESIQALREGQRIVRKEARARCDQEGKEKLEHGKEAGLVQRGQAGRSARGKKAAKSSTGIIARAKRVVRDVPTGAAKGAVAGAAEAGSKATEWGRVKRPPTEKRVSSTDRRGLPAHEPK